MAAGLEPIIDETVNGSDGGVHRIDPLREGVWRLFPQDRSWAPLFLAVQLYPATWVT